MQIQLAYVEPHKPLMMQPQDKQKLYKIMTIEDFQKSMQKSYLHFQRVDTYKDDGADGEQLILDRLVNKNVKFLNSESYNGETYYDACRARTYAYCVSLEKSDYIWDNYGNSKNSMGKVCLIFNFGKLRDYINQIVQNSIEHQGLMYGETQCKQIFSVNHGIINYINRQDFTFLKSAKSYLPNPIEYIYLKDEKYKQEKEMRISLSALGVGKPALNNGEILEFSKSMQLGFSFRTAWEKGVLEKEILYNDPDLEHFFKDFL